VVSEARGGVGKGIFFSSCRSRYCFDDSTRHDTVVFAAKKRGARKREGGGRGGGEGREGGGGPGGGGEKWGEGGGVSEWK